MSTAIFSQGMKHRYRFSNRSWYSVLGMDFTRRVKSIPNAEYQLLLEKRYLCFMPWEKIAVDMGYSIQHIYRLHDWALREFPVPQKT